MYYEYIWRKSAKICEVPYIFSFDSGLHHSNVFYVSFWWFLSCHLLYKNKEITWKFYSSYEQTIGCWIAWPKELVQYIVSNGTLIIINGWYYLQFRSKRVFKVFMKKADLSRKMHSDTHFFVSFCSRSSSSWYINKNMILISMSNLINNPLTTLIFVLRRSKHISRRFWIKKKLIWQKKN